MVYFFGLVGAEHLERWPRSKPLELMPGTFTTPTLMTPPAQSSGGPGPGQAPAPVKAKAAPKRGADKATKVPKAKSFEQEAKGVTRFKKPKTASFNFEH